MKLDRVSYLDEAIRDKQDLTGPGHYKPKVSCDTINKVSLQRDIVQKRPLTAAKWKAPKKEDWRIKKNEDAPDMATYEAANSRRYVMKSTQAVSMTKSHILTFSSKMAKEKEYIPPAGHYSPEKCYKFVSRPGMKKRC